MGRKAKITFCTCCQPPIELKNYNAIKYHLNKMSNKKRTADSVTADDSDSDSAPVVNKSSVIYVYVYNCFIN